jgi:hypothetical protein
MPGLVPGIHVLPDAEKKDVDGRDKPGHDVGSLTMDARIKSGHDGAGKHRSRRVMQ